MRVLLVLFLLICVALGGCVTPSALKSPCVGASGSPCSRTPLPGGPMTVPA